MNSKLPPRAPGYFLFRGARHIRDAMYEHLNEPVEVLDHFNPKGNVKELAVCMLGRNFKFPLANFEGTWEALNVGEGA